MKICKYCKCSLPFGMTCTCFVSPTGLCEPAVAQTELPPLEAYCYGPKNHNFYLKRDVDERIASLTQRLQEQESQVNHWRDKIRTSGYAVADEIVQALAGLKTQLETVLDRESANVKRHADRREALERSHKALLESMGRFLAYWESDFIKVTCADGRTLAEQMGRMTAALAAAEKL